MLRISAVTLVLVFYLAVAQAGFLSWIFGPKGHKLCKVEFEVLDPQGVRLWTKYRPETKMFGIELYINPTGRTYVCSLCKNTTQATHGKFFLQDDSVIVREGDKLKYVAITDDGNTIKRHKTRKLVVNDYLIKPKDSCNCTVPPEITVPVVPTVTQPDVSTAVPTTVHDTDSNSEIDLLERVVLGLSTRCSAGGYTSNYLVLQQSPQDDLMAQVTKYFKADPFLEPYTDAVMTAESYKDGIAFQVKSIIDKLKILKLAQNEIDILDFDAIEDVDKIDIKMSKSNDV